MKTRSLLGIVMAGCLCAGAAPLAKAQCAGYTATSGSATFVPGATDIGLYADDSSVNITLPFSFSLYGNAYTSVNVDSNGFMDFTIDHSDGGFYFNQCPLPNTASSGMGPAIMPYWDDLRTDPDAGAGLGVFTDVIGTAPNRTFVIEWRAVHYNTACGNAHFEVLLYENTSSFDVVYGDTGACAGNSATVGVQDAPITGNFTSYSCNSGGRTNGSSVHFSCILATEGACCDGSGGCTPTLPADCAPASFHGVGSTCSPTNPCGGSCCDPSGTCTITTAATCTGGSTYIDGALCSANPCVGACCDSNFGFCEIASSTDCATFPGNFLGVGVTCDTVVCPTVGTCCDNNTGACTLTTGMFECDFNTSFNASLTCDVNPCVVIGNCCDTTSGACSVIYGGDCSFGSIFNGGAACSAPVCPVLGTCCNNVSGACSLNYGPTCPDGSSAASDVSCAPTTCPVTGTCCTNLGGTCSVIYGGSCPTNSSGSGSLSCSPAPCVAIGICCDTITSQCTVIYGGFCLPNAAYDGSTLSCTPPPCPQIAWACCLPDSSCLSLFQNDCTAHNGAWQPGSACDIICSGAPNLLVNPGAETGDMTGWNHIDDGSGWFANDNGTPVHSGQYAFETSYEPESRSQEVDLLAAGYTAAQLDASPSITAGEWVAQRQGNGHGGGYFMYFELRDASHAMLASGGFGTQAAMLTIVASTPYMQQAYTFTGYPAGVRYVYFQDGGWDMGFWSGPYGPSFDDAFVGVSINSPCCSSGGACSVMSDADCITAGGTPAAPGTTCAANPCSGGGAGVCCRGSTCNTTVSQAACTTAGVRAGAHFASGGSACNSGHISHTPCCYGDYNKVNGITVQDIFDFLADWFAGSTYAKVGSDGATTGVTVQNIFDFLGNWFAGGCS